MTEISLSEKFNKLYKRSRGTSIYIESTQRSEITLYGIKQTIFIPIRVKVKLNKNNIDVLTDLISQNEDNQNLIDDINDYSELRPVINNWSDVDNEKNASSYALFVTEHLIAYSLTEAEQAALINKLDIELRFDTKMDAQYARHHKLILHYFYTPKVTK